MPSLKLSDGTIHFDLVGQGPPVLFIHGAGVASSGWGPQVGELSENFQCLSFDNRGIGSSDAAVNSLTIGQMASDARALLDIAGWDSAHVVGHSMGGLIAQQLALDAPGRVRSLALLCTFSRGAEAVCITPRIIWMGMQTRIGTRSMRRRAFLRMLFSEEFVGSQGARELAARTAPVIGRDLADSPPIMMKQLAAMRAYDRSGSLDRLARIPTLVASAERDPIALPLYGRRLHERIPGSRYVEIAGVSHGVTLEMPAQVNQLLKSHFDAVTFQQSPSPAWSTPQ